MRSPEDRARKWLRVYPRAYRARRGDEVVATLLDKARDDPRLRVREIASVLAHGWSMRVRQLRVAVVALIVAVVGAGIGAGIGLWNGPDGYAATTTVNPASIHAAPHPLTLLSALSARFTGFLQSPISNAILEFKLTAPYPTCSHSVVSATSSRGIEMRCTSSTAETARTATSNLVGAFSVMFEGLKQRHFERSRQEIAVQIQTNETQLAETRREITITGNPVLRGGLAHNANRVADQIAVLRSISSALTKELKSPGALVTETGGPTTATHRVATLPIAIGAVAGLLFGLAVGRRRRHEPGMPLPA
jgi:hypothetical protein